MRCVQITVQIGRKHALFTTARAKSDWTSMATDDAAIYTCYDIVPDEIPSQSEREETNDL